MYAYICGVYVLSHSVRVSIYSPTYHTIYGLNPADSCSSPIQIAHYHLRLSVHWA